MTRLPRLWAAAALFTVAAPLSARAQSASAPAATDVAAAPVAPAPASEAQPVPAGPTLASAAVALRAPAERPIVVVRSPEAEAAVPNALAMQRATNRNATTLMIVGGAAFIAGAIIGDTPGTIIMVGGAGIGLYGLYLYLQ